MNIENYRGFEIDLNINDGIFSCVISDNNSKEGKSLIGIRNYIDKFKKENTDFTQFKIVNHPMRRNKRNNNYTVIGLRKDKKFIIEYNEKEKKRTSISKCSEDEYILDKECNKALFEELYRLDDDFKDTEKIYREKIKDTIEKMDISLLKDISKE